MTRRPLLAAVALLAALTVIITWPAALHLGTRVPGHDDPLFSMWRLAWVAHALPHDPRHLFDANIFYPHLRTLAYSDAMLFEGIVAAPFLWAGINPVLVYNLMFFAGIVSSGAGMFVLVRYLTRDIGAALVAAVIFTLAPYRIEHFIHLELQWTVWMPLALWAVHRTFDGGGFKFGALTGLFLWLQIISCVYYGAFLGLIVAGLALLLLASRPEQAAPRHRPAVSRRAARRGADAAVRAAVSGGDARARSAAGRRSADVQRGMGQLSGGAAPELALGMDGVGLWRQRAPSVSRRRRVPARGDRSGAAAAAPGLDLFRAHRCWRSSCRSASTARSTDGSTITPSRSADFARRRGSRSSPAARCRCWPASAISSCSASSPRHRRGDFSSPRCWSRSVMESGSSPLELAAQPTAIPPVYRFLQTVSPSVILELPAETTSRPTCSGRRITGTGCVNGYSGYTPGDHLDTMTLMGRSPTTSRSRGCRSWACATCSCTRRSTSPATSRI